MIVLDYETYSDVDLFKHGLDRYVSSENFKVLCASVTTIAGTEVYDFVSDLFAMEKLISLLRSLTTERVYAHNAEFEAAVTRTFMPDCNVTWVDTAVLSRMAGGSSSLDSAARQFLGGPTKVAAGADLIKLFCMPGELQEANGSGAFDPSIVTMYPNEWHEFVHIYCATDTEITFDLASCLVAKLAKTEEAHLNLTSKMNNIGWPVDLALVDAMIEARDKNRDAQLAAFQEAHDPAGELNFNSPKQLAEFAKQHGVRVKSLAELPLSKLLVKVQDKVDAGEERYRPVLDMLLTKQALGGSSLAKLEKIKDMTSADGRLRHQYMHVGAGQSYRTSGAGVQLQNLKRFDGNPGNLSNLDLWDNTKIANNIRQVFRADPGNVLMVADYSGVESRALAWLADEAWLLTAVESGLDPYKMMAAYQFRIPYDEVTKKQRTHGKFGVLQCGYGAGAQSVKDVAEKQGVTMSIKEAFEVVENYRENNSNIVALWNKVDNVLRAAIATGGGRASLGPANSRVSLDFDSIKSPPSLKAQAAARGRSVTSVRMTVLVNGNLLFERVFHGLYMHGNEIRYYKPRSAKGGDPWSATFTDANGKVQPYKLYGGKLVGILTQSFCRELFMTGLEQLFELLHPDVKIFGQLHDEVVIEAAAESVQLLQDALSERMTGNRFDGLPLDVEVKWAVRYIK